ncbi:MAG: FAD-dependent oxidoreductase [Planctomyces sp.]
MSNNESSAGGNSVTDEQSMRRPLIRFAIKFLTILTCLSCLLLLPGVTQVRHRDAQASGPSPTKSAQQPATAGGDESDTSDVVIVGAGISGLATALDLGRSGVQVTVVDMASVFGGHAVMSQGSVSIVDTPVQKSAGIQDSPALAFEDFHRWGEDPKTEWVRYYVDHSRVEIYDWLNDLGVRFSGVVASQGNSVPREHQPTGRGIGLVSPIYRACLELDKVQFRWNTKVEQLIRTGDRITGVETRDMRTGKTDQIRARAVVLATGGFQNNLEMVRRFWPAEFRFPDRILTGSGINSVGFGHQMAESVGGQLFYMDHQWNYYSGLPDPRYPGTNKGLNVTNLYGILVNSEGRRFANDHGWAKEVMPALLRQDKVTVWVIFDEANRHNFIVSGTDWGDFDKVDRLILQDPKLVSRADTLEELAAIAGLPADNLTATVARYNELVETGEDADFGRFGVGKPDFSNSASPKIQTPPYYAMQTFPLTRKSMGGVAIDLQARVVNSKDQPIPGLYAVGELAGLAGINGKAALEGTFLGPCILTGRIAARSVLKELRQSTAENAAAESSATLSETGASSSGQSCLDCHSMDRLEEEPEPGFRHFSQVHRAAMQRGFDCRQCHSELAPWREEAHRIDHRSLTSSCIHCHVATE